MKLIEPQADLWSEEQVTPEEHIARCASVCYNSHPKDPQKLIDSLKKNGHLSMFRHATIYAHLSNYGYWVLSPFINHYFDKDNDYVSFNWNTALDGNYVELDIAERVSASDFLKLCKEKPELFEIYRLTFCLTTQISTSRELNRVSPNNIAERSTRYCSSKDGLEICKPWWVNDEYERNGYRETDKMTCCFTAWQAAEEHYQRLLALGLKPEDARGVLPLDTATKVVYTYSVRTWKHILDLRYYGKTGRPQPNCKLIMGKVRDKINQFAQAHNIDYQV